MMRRPPRQQLHRALQKAAPQEIRDAMNSGNTVAAAQKQAAASKSSDESDTDKELNSAQGLNLSTAEEDSITSGEKKSDGESSVKINTVFAIALAVTGSGLVLILVTALIIWYFRKNWRRWGRRG